MDKDKDLLSALMELLEDSPAGDTPTEDPPQIPFDPAMILKISSLMEEMTRETDDTRLLYALRPFLRPERRQKVDTAAGICRLMRMLPQLMEEEHESS